ncbi:MAG: tyrosine-type recombinase/integrase [Thermoplasmatales archaeon]|nr:tyrosine-type recombinase/integrase [Thermoplasmatales archaeon]
MIEPKDFKGKAELDRFIESLRADKKSENTLYCYERFVIQMLKWINKEPKDITLDDLNNYKIYLSNYKPKKIYSAESLITHIASIKTFFRTLGLETAEKLKSPKKPKHLIDVLTEDEVKRILEKAKDTDPMDYAMISVMYYGGLRVSEVTNLTLDNINFNEGTIRINNGKGNKDGIIYIHSDALNAVKNYLSHRLTPIDGSNALFVSTKRTRITDSTIGNRVKGYAVKAGVTKRVYPHLFRHSFATYMLQNGATLTDVQSQLRHDNISTTTKYIHLADRQLKKAYNDFVPSVMQPKPEKAQSDNLIELLEKRYIKGEIPTDIYRNLKNKYEQGTTSENNIEKRVERPIYIG